MTRYFLVFVVSLAVLVLWVLSLLAFRQMTETNRSLRTTYQMAATVERMIITTQQTEGAFEAYALTGLPDHLGRWEASRKAFVDQANTLGALLERTGGDPGIAIRARDSFGAWTEAQQATRIFGAPDSEREELVANLLESRDFLFDLRAASSSLVNRLEGLHASLADDLDATTLTTQLLRTRFDRIAAALAAISLASVILALWLLVRRGRLIQEHNEQLRAEASARNAANLEIERVSRRQGLILDAAANGIIGIHHDGEIVFRNPAAVRMLGEERVAIGARLEGAMADAPPGEIDPLLAPLHDRKPRAALEASFHGGDGSTFPAEYASIPVLDGDDVSGVVVTFQDITERLEVDRMKTEFISVVSHELRTPLTSLRGSLGLLASGRMGTLDPSGTRMLEIAVESADRLIRLVNDILDMERLAAARVTLEIQTIDLLECGRKAIDQIRELASAAAVELTLRGESTLVLADPHRVHQVIANLISNAIKFSAEGQEVAILVGSDEGGVPRLQVRDSGRGIPADQLEGVFDRFTQVDSSDARRHGGTGLGLAISRSIIDQHGGRIWAESEPGRGSTFSFILPAPPDADEESMGQSASDRPRVLLYCWGGDADGMARTLESAGYVPVRAEESDILIEAARVDPFAILLDLSNAGSEGLAILEKLHSDPTTREIPAVVIADIAPATEGDTSDAFVEWIRSPVRPEDVVAAVMTACEHRSERPHILIVEDDDAMADVIREGFRRHGIETERAATGREAVTLALRNPPTVVVLDLMLPGGNGEWVVSWMRQDEKLRDTHLVVYSARDLTERDRERLTLGQTIFMTKGQVEPGEFERRVADIFKEVGPEASTRNTSEP